jgi:ABC-2 type transport system permease protein
MFRRMLALITARNKEFYRDRAVLVWTFVFPFVVLLGFAYGYSGKQDPLLRLGVVGEPPAEAAALLELPGTAVTRHAVAAPALRKLERYELDLVLGHEDGALAYWVAEGTDRGRLAERLLEQTLAARAPAASPVRARRQALTGRRVRYADWLLPGLIAMNIMFGSMFGVGYVIVRYRKNGVLKRLRATPLSAFQFLAAQIVSRMLLMVVTSLLVLGGAALLIGFRPAGSVLDFALFLAASSTAMISVGLLVAARLASEEVADGVLNLMTWPMIFLSGIWFSLDGASAWVLAAAKLMPLTHVVDGLRAILIDGAPLTAVLPQVGILLALSAVFTAIGSAIFRWR